MRAVILLMGWCVFGLAAPAFGQDAAPTGPRPPVEIVVTPGQASAVPVKRGVAYVNGGVIDVTQPNPTTMVVTMTGLTAADADLLRASVAQYQFELAQDFEVVFNSKRVKSAKLTVESRVVGLLRTEFNHEAGCLHFRKKWATAETQDAVTTVNCGSAQVVTVTLPGRATPGCDDLSVYDHFGPVAAEVGAGTYSLSETWGFGVTHPAFQCRGASAEFSPQPSYIPSGYWLSDFRPFNGLATRDFGFQMTLKVMPVFLPEEEPKPGTKP